MSERRVQELSLPESSADVSEHGDGDIGTPRGLAAAPAADITSRFAPELAQLVVVMLWASTFVATKAAFAEVSPLAFLFSRFAIMVALAFAVLLLRQRGAGRRVDRSDWRLFALAGLTGYTLYQLGFMLGLSRTSPFSSSLLIAMVPLFTVLILAVMGEPTPVQGWVGLGVALIGVAIFLLDKRDASAGTLYDSGCRLPVMARRLVIAPHLTVSRTGAALSAVRGIRWRAVSGRSCGCWPAACPPPRWPACTGYSVRWVQEIARRYREDGPAAHRRPPAWQSWCGPIAECCAAGALRRGAGADRPRTAACGPAAAWRPG